MGFILQTAGIICIATGAVVWSIPVFAAAGFVYTYIRFYPRLKRGETVTTSCGPFELDMKINEANPRATYKKSGVMDGEIINKKD